MPATNVFIISLASPQCTGEKLREHLKKLAFAEPNGKLTILFADLLNIFNIAHFQGDIITSDLKKLFAAAPLEKTRVEERSNLAHLMMLGDCFYMLFKCSEATERDYNNLEELFDILQRRADKLSAKSGLNKYDEALLKWWQRYREFLRDLFKQIENNWLTPWWKKNKALFIEMLKTQNPARGQNFTFQASAASGQIRELNALFREDSIPVEIKTWADLLHDMPLSYEKCTQYQLQLTECQDYARALLKDCGSFLERRITELYNKPDKEKSEKTQGSVSYVDFETLILAWLNSAYKCIYAGEKLNSIKTAQEILGFASKEWLNVTLVASPKKTVAIADETRGNPIEKQINALCDNKLGEEFIKRAFAGCIALSALVYFDAKQKQQAFKQNFIAQLNEANTDNHKKSGPNNNAADSEAQQNKRLTAKEANAIFYELVNEKGSCDGVNLYKSITKTIKNNSEKTPEELAALLAGYILNALVKIEAYKSKEKLNALLASVVDKTDEVYQEQSGKLYQTKNAATPFWQSGNSLKHAAPEKQTLDLPVSQKRFT